MTPTLAHHSATKRSSGSATDRRGGATERRGGSAVMGDQPVGIGGSGVGGGAGGGVGGGAGVGGQGGTIGSDGSPLATVTSIEVTEFPLGLPLEQAAELIVGVLTVLEPSRLTGPDALRLYEQFAGVERLGMSGKTLLAPRIDESDVYRDHGHRNTAALLADIEGVPTGQARNTLDVGQRLARLPGTEEALRTGTLSGPKVTELSAAAILDPDREAELLQGAAEQPLAELKERCRRSRATSANHDPVGAVRRIRADRNFTWWTDAEGAFCYKGRDTADRGAKIIQQMDHTAAKLKKDEDRSTQPGGTDEPPTTEPNRRADAFYLLVTSNLSTCSHRGADAEPVDDSDPGPPEEQISSQLEFGAQAVRPLPTRPDPARPPDSADLSTRPEPADSADPADPATVAAPRTDTSPPADVIDRPPTCSVMVRVDLDALLRGTTLPGENCEIDNFGPIPVAMARDMTNDSFLRFVFYRAGDIRAVSHFGRTINRHLRTALAHRDRRCVVPGCSVSYGLEIDHIQGFAQGGPTELGNLALLCHHHHYLKTYEGWTLERTGPSDVDPQWTFTPMPPFGQEPDPQDG